jgi:cytosine deaminase
MVLLQASDPIEAIRLRATRLAVMSKGKVVSRMRSSAAELNLPGRPKSVDRRHVTAREKDQQ